MSQAVKQVRKMVTEEMSLKVADSQSKAKEA